MSGAVRFGRASGVPVVADTSVMVLMFTFGTAVFLYLRQVVPSTSADAAGIAALAAGVSIVVSVFLHEYGHVVVATRRGLTVREIRLSMFGGYSAITGEPTPKTELVVAAAGPLVSLSVAAASAVFASALGSGNTFGAVVRTLAIANLAIGVVNLLPGFPLDGGRALRGFLSHRGMGRERATEFATTVGRTLGFVAVGIGLVLLAANESSGLFWIVGGWVLSSTARSAGTREALRVAFDGMTVSDLMRETRDAVPGTTSITDLLSLYGSGARLRSLPVQVTGRVVGVIGQREVDSISPSRWPMVRVSAIMSKIGPADVFEADASVESLLFHPSGSSGRVIVVRDNIAVGIIEGKDLSRLLA